MKKNYLFAFLAFSLTIKMPICTANKLQDAIRSSDTTPEQIQSLLQQGYDLREDDNGAEETAFAVACFEKRLDILNKMITVHPNRVDEAISMSPNHIGLKHSLLHEVVRMGWLKIAKWLIMHGADVNKLSSSDGMSSLHWASITGCPKIIQLLINNGADINALDRGGRTPLYIAKERKECFIDLAKDYPNDKEYPDAINGFNHIIKILLEAHFKYNLLKLTRSNSKLFDAVNYTK